MIVFLTVSLPAWASTDQLAPADSEKVVNQSLQGSLELEGYEIFNTRYTSVNGLQVSKDLILIRTPEGAESAYRNGGLSFNTLQEVLQDFNSPVNFSSRASQYNQKPSNIDDASDGMLLIIDREADALASQAAADAYMRKWGLEPESGGDGLDSATLSSEYGTSCPKNWKCRSKDFAKNFNQNLNNTLELIKNSYGSVNLDLTGDVKAEAKAKLDYRYKKKFGIIYKVKVDFLDSKLKYIFEGKLKLHGKAEHNFEGKEFELFQAKIYDDYFMVGFIPVQVDIKTYIRAGTGDLKLSASGEVGMDKPMKLEGTFSYVCDAENCVKESESVDNIDESLDIKNLNYQLMAKAEIEPYLNAAIRGRLYWGSIYAEVGIQPSLPLKFFGYMGNMCGDGDGRDGDEYVTAALLSADIRVGVTWKTRFLVIKSDRKYSEFYRKALMYKDLLNPSTALSPIVRVHTSTRSYDNVSAEVSLRGCTLSQIDQRFQDFTLEWGDIFSTDISDLEKTVTLTSTKAPGKYVLKVTHSSGAFTQVPYEVIAPNPGGNGNIGRNCATTHVWDADLKKCVLKRPRIPGFN